MSDDQGTTVQEKKDKVMGKINEIKSNIETFIADVNVNEIKASVNTMMKDAQKDINKLVDKDLVSLKKKFHKEKAILEKKANKFLDGHKKEIQALKSKFEKMVKSSKKSPAKSAAAAGATKKKVSKKVAKVVKKVAKKK